MPPPMAESVAGEPSLDGPRTIQLLGVGGAGSEADALSGLRLGDFGSADAAAVAVVAACS